MIVNRESFTAQKNVTVKTVLSLLFTDFKDKYCKKFYIKIKE